MDCEFFEESYYFSQLGPQGESVGDDLSWLTYPIRMDPPEQVGNTVDTTTDHIVSSPQITPILFDKHPNEPEVKPKPELFFDDMSDTVPTDDVLLSNDVLSDNDMLNVEMPLWLLSQMKGLEAVLYNKERREKNYETWIIIT